MDSFARLFWKRRFGRVRRFHTEGIAQNVAEHSAGVALILLETVPDCSANLLRAAIYHDLQEGITGDIPATVKWDASEEFRNHLNGLEQQVRETYRFTYTLTEIERRQLKAADVLDGMFTCLEERARGNMEADGPFEAWESYVYSKEGFFECAPGMAEIWNSICCSYRQLMDHNRAPLDARANRFWRISGRQFQV